MEKFEKEKQLLVIMDEMMDQVDRFDTEEKVVDFTKIADSLKHLNLNPRACKKLWDGIRKNLQESYKCKPPIFHKF